MHDRCFVSQLASGSVGDAPFFYKNNQGSIIDYCVDGEGLGVCCVCGGVGVSTFVKKKEIYKKASHIFL